MKDAYSFDKDQEGLDKAYSTMYDVYTRIFKRLGLDFRAVLADTGAIGGNGSHQFMAFSDAGESDVVYCPCCGYAADVEKAEAVCTLDDKEEMKPLEEIETPNCKTIDDVCTYINIDPKKSIKAVVLKETETNKIYFCFVRGDREVNIIKFVNAINSSEAFVTFATEEEIKAKKFAMASKKENAEENAKEEARKKAKEQGKKFDEKAYDKQQGAKFSGRPDGAKIAGDEPAKDSDAKDIRNDSTRIAVNGKAAADSLLAIQKKNAEDSLFYKSEYVPVTSFIHTVKFDNYRRIYEAYQTPADYYLKEYYDAGRLTGDSIYDQTKHWHMKNTFAIAMLEGFNKWAKAGLKAFASYDLRHYELPTMEGGFEKYNEHALSVGGQLSKQEGKTLHYNAVAEIGLTGVDAGTLAIDGNVDVNIPFLGDTLQVRGDAFFHRETPSFYYRNYHARHLWWENDLDKTIHTRIMGTLSFPKTRTKLRVAVDEIKNYTYFSQSYDITEEGLRTGVIVTPMQESGGINLLTAQLEQNFRLGILNWENQFTYQHSSKESVLPVPAFNAYTNLYIKFKVVKVLNVDLGADMRYFTSYEAPDYSPYMGQYTVQGNGKNNVKIGNYPIVNVYANVHIKHTRFFVMMSHINAGQGDKNYFFAPHYPMNERVFRIGVSWNFFN